ncbi:MAG: hypothetical protein M3Y74_20470 [Chloroflexota bacterium]|nr:hypothetical protein [Chloroflexota bacterium]
MGGDSRPLRGDAPSPRITCRAPIRDRRAPAGRLSPGLHDGSFITAKEEPGDFDACWENRGVEGRLLDPVLLMFANGRAAQKAAYGGEFFIAESVADPHGTRYLAFFQQTRDGTTKGIVALTIGEES